MFSILNGHFRIIPFRLLPNNAQSGLGHPIHCRLARDSGRLRREIPDLGMVAEDDKSSSFYPLTASLRKRCAFAGRLRQIRFELRPPETASHNVEEGVLD